MEQSIKDNKHISSAFHQIEDAVLKTMMQFFSEELFPYFNIEGEIDHIGPTETIHLELKKFYEDFNFVMKDGSWIHFEFQSSNNKPIDNLKRFRCYEALASYQHNIDVHTYVLYSGTIEHPVTEFTSGINTYRIHPIIMKGHRAEEVFDNITEKLNHSIPLKKEDLVPLTLCPLMSGDIPQKERIKQAIQIIHQQESTIPDTNKLEAVIYAMASKFLDNTEFNEIKEAVKMTELGLFIYNDGIADGIEKASLENAKSFFINGASFEIVRKSISNLTDEALQQIYDEVMASKKQKNNT